eukprot:SAG11_NODE_29336_length_312_cov_0.469484_1_plen_48_part_01
MEERVIAHLLCSSVRVSTSSASTRAQPASSKNALNEAAKRERKGGES